MDEENNVSVEKIIPVSPPSMLSFLSYSGRFGRLNFAQALAVIYAIPFIITAVSKLAPNLFSHSLTKIAAIVFILIALIPMLIRALALRLHDFNWSGAVIMFVIAATFFATFLFKIPGYWILAPFILILLLIPGNKKSNDYGAPSQKSSYFGLIIFLAMVIANTLMK